MNTAPLMAPDGRAHLPGLADAVLRLELLEVGGAQSLGLFEIDPGAERRIRAGENHRPHRRVVVSFAQLGVQRPKSGLDSTHFGLRAGSWSAL